ncbi:CHRD domain-containing protein [Streptomyces sp. NPDC007325]|uniref:CHRD domain-containing protein n=1 Tax=Streptomyces sp. NPDC007325 TaxID=3154588 RepID=UPI0033C45F65
MRRLIAVLAAVTAAAGLAGTTRATADDGPAVSQAAGAPALSLIARLTGGQQVPGKSGAALGDRDGKAIALVKVKGDRVTFALSWTGIDRPARAHLHRGATGSEGAVVADLFATPMPASVYSAAGQTTLSSAALAEQLRRDPGGFSVPASVYSAAGQTTLSSAALAEQLRRDPGGFSVDLHTDAFPEGAVHGRLRPFARPVNPLDIINGGDLRALADGGQEIPAGSPERSGDPDGHATAFLHPRKARVDYSLAWVNTGPPLTGHVHEGALGENGAVRLPLFTSPVPKNVFAVSGSVSAPDASLIARLRTDPTGFYANLTTQEFPDGAVRGQLFR